MVLVSPTDHAQHVKVRAEEQRVKKTCGDEHVGQHVNERAVETAKTLTKPRPHIAQVMLVRCSRSETDAATPGSGHSSKSKVVTDRREKRKEQLLRERACYRLHSFFGEAL